MNMLKRCLHTMIFFPFIVFSQNAIKDKQPFEDNVISGTGKLVVMPYNRMINSAGKVISYGDSSLENHAMDLCVLPDKKSIAIEDRYGIAILSIKSKEIMTRWDYDQDNELKNLVSTYSGITSFVFNNKTFIAWGASAQQSDQSAIIIAGWDGKKIDTVTEIPVAKKYRLPVRQSLIRLLQTQKMECFICMLY
jgi:hypothetical protein